MEKILCLGNVLLPVPEGNATVPFGTQVQTKCDFLNKVLTEFETSQYNNYDWLSDRVVLDATNDTIDSINSLLLKRPHGDFRSY